MTNLAPSYLDPAQLTSHLPPIIVVVRQTILNLPRGIALESLAVPDIGNGHLDL